MTRGGDILIANMKKAFSVFLFLGLVLGFTSFVYASESTQWVDPEPFWAHTAGISANLNINNSGRATMSGTVVGNLGTTHIVVNAVLDRVNPNGTTTRIVTFNNIRAEGNVWAWERPHYVARGHDYRVTIYSTVFRNGTSETVSMSSRVVRAN
jgi:hypothetical protein